MPQTQLTQLIHGRCGSSKPRLLSSSGQSPLRQEPLPQPASGCETDCGQQYNKAVALTSGGTTVEQRFCHHLLGSSAAGRSTTAKSTLPAHLWCLHALSTFKHAHLRSLVERTLPHCTVLALSGALGVPTRISQLAAHLLGRDRWGLKASSPAERVQRLCAPGGEGAARWRVQVITGTQGVAARHRGLTFRCAPAARAPCGPCLAVFIPF